MRVPPPFFEPIRQAAARRWDQLDADPELAGPWWQLFRQVQSPRHVLSELLQNAEDAGAHRVSVHVEGDQFIFQHDGHDFSEDEFRSLCRFGYSNKRSLLTIGFRGIGFRSVFSLGDPVKVESPSIACLFQRKRFSEPIWVPGHASTTVTTISCRVESPETLTLIRSEIVRWAASPTPLLFFKSIRRLRFGDREVIVEPLGHGPCPGSEFLGLGGADHRVLAIRSAPEPLPEDALAEIREERGDPSIELPAVDVAVVLGTEAEGRVHVVLPTDVVLRDVPVAIHGPFIQDPGRVGIKDPATSPTNRVLLGRVGELLAASLEAWVGNPQLDMERRAEAYGLLPRRRGDGFGVAGGAAKYLLEALASALAEKPISLCADGELHLGAEVAALPKAVLDAWPPEQALDLVSAGARYALAPEAAAEYVGRLAAWDFCSSIDLAAVMKALESRQAVVPRPSRLEALVPLWAEMFAITSRSSWQWRDYWSHAPVIPGRARASLHSVGQVLTAATERPAGIEGADWEWLLSYISVVDATWAFWARAATPVAEVAEACSAAGIPVSDETIRALREAYDAAGLGRAAAGAQLVGTAARSLRQQGGSQADWVRIARIAWRLQVDLGSAVKEDVSFFVTRDGTLRPLAYGLLARTPTAGDVVCPDDWRAGHQLSDAYAQGLTPGDLKAWLDWATSPRGGRLLICPMPTQTMRQLNGRQTFADVVRLIGGRAPESYDFKSSVFFLYEAEWGHGLVEHWKRAYGGGEGVWARVGVALCEQATAWPDLFSPALCHARAAQVSQLGTTRSVDIGPARAAWIEMLRANPSLFDEFGHPRLPAELFRRTQETSVLVGLEPFVRADLDTPGAARLLDLLGVRSVVAGSSSILERLTQVSGTQVPVGKLRDLYRALERVVARLDESGIREVRAAFDGAPLVRTATTWRKAAHVFRSNPYGMPGVDVIHPDFEDLGHLWERLHVRLEPTLNDVTEWVRSVPLDTPLPEPDGAGLRAALQRLGVQVWRDCQRWLNGLGHLAAVGTLQWSARDARALDGMYAHHRKGVADFSFIDTAAWSALEAAVPAVVDARLRLHPEVSSAQAEASESGWLTALGRVLSRLEATSNEREGVVASDRLQGARLSATSWIRVSDLVVTPTLDGLPVGQKRSVRVVWHETRLLAVGPSSAVFKELLHELTRPFGSEVASATIRDCAGRDPAWIDAYAHQHLQLAAAAVVGRGPGATRDAGAAAPAGQGEPAAATLPEPAEAPPDEPGETQKAQLTGAEPPAEHRSAKKDQEHQRGRDRLESFLRARGCVWKGEQDAFVGENLCIQRGKGLFPWEWLSAGQTRPLWIADRSLDHALGIELPAEVWEFGKEHAALLLEPQPGHADYTLHEFASLERLVASDRLGLFPASYRLRRG